MTTKYIPRCGFDPLDPYLAAERADLDRADLPPCKPKEPDRLHRVAAFAGAGPRKKLAPGLDHSEYRLVPKKKSRRV
jgi:hypothetical protein